MKNNNDQNPSENPDNSTPGSMPKLPPFVKKIILFGVGSMVLLLVALFYNQSRDKKSENLPVSTSASDSSVGNADSSVLINSR